LNTVFEKLDRIAGEINTNSYLSLFTFRVVRTRREFENSLALVQREYLRKNYCTNRNEGLRLTPFHLLPETIVFSAFYKKQVVATLSVIFDSPFGLPMDKLFRAELIPYRNQGNLICEASTFAVDSDFFGSENQGFFDPKRLSFVIYFYKIAVIYSKLMKGVEHMFVTINPRHNLMYIFLTFTDICNEIKSYEFVNDAPAKAKVMNLKRIDKTCQSMGLLGLQSMFRENLAAYDMFSDKYVLDYLDLEYFLEKCESLSDSYDTVSEILEVYFPELFLVESI